MSECGRDRNPQSKCWQHRPIFHHPLLAVSFCVTVFGLQCYGMLSLNVRCK